MTEQEQNPNEQITAEPNEQHELDPEEEKTLKYFISEAINKKLDELYPQREERYHEPTRIGDNPYYKEGAAEEYNKLDDLRRKLPRIRFSIE